MSSDPWQGLKSLDPFLKEVYEQRLEEQLRWGARVFGSFPEPKPLTKKQKLIKKWKRFWNHIPDFIDFIKEYEYQDWRYWDRDGF